MILRVTPLLLVILISLTWIFRTSAKPFELASRIASAQGDVVAVERSLRSGVDPNAADALGWTALHWAAGRGHLAVVRLLISSGADVNIATRSGNARHMLTAEPDTIERQVNDERGGDPPISPGPGRLTPLMLAAAGGHYGCVKALLEAGADKAMTDGWGDDVLTYAQGGRNKRILEVLSVKDM